MTDERSGLIGRSVVRPDAVPKITGTFRFSNDVHVPGALFGATVRSPHPSARIVAIDASAARRMPGVVGVLTADDVPGDRLIGHIVADQPVFAWELVRYVGEPVAFVVATTQEQAWLAAAAVEVVYEPLPAVTDPEAALAPDAPRLHPGGNCFRRLELRRGDPDRPAPVEVSGVWETGRQDQAFLAPESAVAVPDPDGGVTLHLATQDLHTDQRQIAAALGLDDRRVRLVNEGIGGAFGGREDITLQVHLCLAAVRTGAPVRTTYRRGESFLAHPKRHPARLWVTVGADPDGTLQVVRARILLDGGAYASTSGPVLATACSFAAGPYRVPSVHVVGESVATNNPVSGAMRGFGAVQACFGIESTLDLLAARLGIDPVDLRRRNLLQPGDPFPTTGQTVGPSAPLREVLDRCVALPLPPPAAAAAAAIARPGGVGDTTRGEGVRRGVGVAMGVKNTLYGAGFEEWSVATVRVGGAGAEVESAAAECGQGIASALTQIASHELGGLPVTLAPATTAAGYAGSSSASRQTWMSGSAVQLAARRVAEALLDRAAARTGLPRGVLRLGPEGVIGPEGSLPLADLLGDEVLAAQETYRAPATDAPGPDGGQGDLHVAWMFVAHRAVVDVDVELGTVKVVQVATAQDVGRALNPREVFGQIAGGISQGIGLALTEHLDAPGGVPVNASFTDYLIPTAPDMPEVTAVLVESPEPAGPYGLKGAGEPPSLSSTAAVAAAIRAATGRPVTRVPVRPDDLVC